MCISAGPQCTLPVIDDADVGCIEPFAKCTSWRYHAVRTVAHAVTRFVLVGLLVKVLLGLALAATAYLFPTFEPPSLGVVSTIVAVSIALAWYGKVVNRPMLRSEILRFAAGMAVADLGFSAVWVLAMLWETGQPLTWQGLGIVFGLSGPTVANEIPLVMAFGALVGTV